MPAEGVPGFLQYRVVNRLTGAEVIHNLPHLHTSTWRVNAMQQGAPGSAAVGTFRIPLFPPLTDEFRAAKAFYDQLDYGLRVEGYLGPVGAAAPRYAGFIRGIQKSFNSYVLTGSTDVWLMQATRLFPGEAPATFASSAGIFGVAGNLGPISKDWADDFSAYSAGNYTAVGVWTSGSDSFASYVTCSAGADSTLKANTGSTSGMVEASGQLALSADATNGGMAGVTIGTRGARIVGRNGNAVDVQIIHNIGGVIVVDATASSVFAAVSPPFKFTLQLIRTLPGTTTDQYKVFLNGKDCGLTFSYSTPTAGAPGLYFNVAASGSSSAIFYNFIGVSRPGTGANVVTANGAPAISGTPGAAVIPLSSMLDVWTNASAAVGNFWRYTPQAMPTSGTLTIGSLDSSPTPGVDRSTSVRFVELDNLIDASIEPNAEFFATSITSPSAQSSSSGGIAHWPNIAAIATYGYLDDIATVIPTNDFVTLRAFAKQIAANKTNLNNAKVITVLRDPATADVWRELDYVTVHSPTLGLNNVKTLVMAYEFTEGSPTQQLWLDQFASGGYELQTRRMGSNLEYLASLFTSR